MPERRARSPNPSAGEGAPSRRAGRERDGGSAVRRRPAAAGRATLLMGPPSPEPYRIFRELTSLSRALVVSGVHPARLRDRHGLEGAEMFWMTALTGSEEKAFGPQDLEFEVLGQVVKHFKRGTGRALLVEDLEYLSLQCGFGSVARFLKSACDASSLSGGTVVASADPEAFTDRERASLASSFDSVAALRPEDAFPRMPSLRPLLPFNSYLWRGAGADCHDFVEGASRGKRLLCVTGHSPRKLQERHGLGRASFIWLSESASGSGIFKPQKLCYEVQQETLRRLRSGRGELVFVEGLERLRLYVELPELVRFVKALGDACGEFGGTFLASEAPGSLDARDEAVLRKRFDFELD